MSDKKSFWLRFIALSLFIASALLAGGLTWAIKSGFISNEWERLKLKTGELAADAGFSLEEVFIEGRSRTQLKDLSLALSVQKNMPIMAINLQQIQENLELLPWIESARVERHLPDKLYIFLEEKMPIALYQEDGIHYPLDANGHLIETSSRGLETFPVVVGEDAAVNAPHLITLLENYPELMNRIKSLKRIGKRRWDILLDDFDDGLLIKLPEKDEKTALQRLDKLQKEQKLLDKNLSEIDLRLEDRLIIKGKRNRPKRKPSISPEELKGDRHA